MRGEILMSWLPESGQTYYFPFFEDDDHYWRAVWVDSYQDLMRYKNGLVCKTIKEANDKAKKMMKAIKVKS